MNITKYPLVVATLLTLALTTGCQSTGSRFVWWKPGSYFNRGETAVAESVPELPSTQFAENDASSAPTADSAPSAPSVASAETIASAPPADYSLFPSEPPATVTTSTTASAGTTAAVTPQTSPYSAVAASTTPTSPVVAPLGAGLPGTPPPESGTSLDSSMTGAMPSSPIASATSTDRYAPTSERYAPLESTTPTNITPPPETAVGAMSPSAPSSTIGSASSDRYSRYSTPAATVAAVPSAPATTSTLPTESPTAELTASAETVATVELPSTPGGYRPGGTTSYPESQASASIATRPESSNESPTASENSAPSPYGRYR